MLDFKTVSKIFYDFLNGKSVIPDLNSKNRLIYLIRLNIETNWKQWHLEDSARNVEFGPKYIASVKYKIDKNNQVRNELIMAIDMEIANRMEVIPLDSQEKFYSESPGMIIDRLAILYIKLSVIKDLLAIIKEADLSKEYRENANIISKQINSLGNFLNLYFDKLKCKEAFFEIQQPVKIYNDKRIKKYIKILAHDKKDLPEVRS